ncbi:hypothetical protein EYF80_038647 [Liparis tanakae]|uniref:Uncharacterized protein n=1 Tax=Liparis tanakae TaxID=230148 RepID=A0A4Z2GC18_9TELE|nr:hypothetical protein EYF80_038647 [Liparis tanakae]
MGGGRCRSHTLHLLNRGQRVEVRGHDRPSAARLMLGARGELSLTQSPVSEPITTSLWAKSAKRFLAYHRFNYSGWEEGGRRSPAAREATASPAKEPRGPSARIHVCFSWRETTATCHRSHQAMYSSTSLEQFYMF